MNESLHLTLCILPDRTLSLLKAGAKALSHKLNTSGQVDSVDLSLPCPSPCKFRSMSSMKQMLLTDKLQLKTSDRVVNVGCGTILALGLSYISYIFVTLFFFQDIRVDLCGCYRLIDRSTVSACYYCDQALCSSCQSVCANCSELFCHNCSLPM